MINHLITLLLIFLILFTPIASGSMELWAFSLMELAILFIIMLAAVQRFTVHGSQGSNPQGHRSGQPILKVSITLLALFLLLILFQMISLPSGILKIISPKTSALRSALSLEPLAFGFPLSAFLLSLSYPNRILQRPSPYPPSGNRDPCLFCYRNLHQP
jgi:hypothetical protein